MPESGTPRPWLLWLRLLVLVAIVLAAVFGGDLSLGATAGAALLIEFVIWYERRAKARRS